MPQQRRIGLIAGNGRFPILWAKAARSKGITVVAFAIRGNTDRKIRKYVDRLHWFNVREFSYLLDVLRKENLKEMVMAGQINPFSLFDPRILLDVEIQSLLKQLEDRRANTVFTAIIQRIEQEGVKFIPSVSFMDEYIPRVGVLGRYPLSEDEWQDVYFGRGIAQKVGELDIGQTVVVKDKTILAVEAFEGTNRCIARGGMLAKGVVVVKMSKPNQDLRFDVPVVGLKTIMTLVSVGASVLAVEAGKTIVLDKERVIRACDRFGIKFVSVQGGSNEIA